MSTGINPRPVRILAVCNHPGGAKALIPVLQSFIDREVAVYVITSHGSMPLFSSLRISCEAVSSNSDRSDRLGIIQAIRPSVILLGTSVPDRLDTEWLEVGFIAAAKTARIKTIAILDHWTRYKDRFLISGESDRYLFPDKICVLDQRAFNEMSNNGFPEERLVITGNPHWDSFGETKNRLRSMNRESLRQRVQIKTTSRVLLFVSQPISSICRGAPEYTECTVLEELLIVLNSTPELADVMLVIKVHPRESKEELRAVLKRTDTAARFVVSSEDLFELAWASDFVVGMFSALLVELSLLGIPVVSYQPGSNPSAITFLGGNVKVTRAPSELKEELLKERVMSSDHSQARPGATARVISEIYEVFAVKG